MTTGSKLKNVSRYAYELVRDGRALNHMRAVAYPIVYRSMFRRRRTHSTKRLFVDMGSNLGQGFDYFKKVFLPEHYTYHFFEPNPHCASVLEKKMMSERFPNGQQLFRNAVWTKRETLRFYGITETGNATTQGGSVIPDHNTRYYASNTEEALNVQAICFAEYISDVQNLFDELVIKMDIEGAELDVLEDAFARKELFIKSTIIFVEFHSIYASQEKRRALRARERHLLKNVPKNVRLLRWY